MSTQPPDDRDLRLARRLDAGEAPDGTDALHDALDALEPGPASRDAASSNRIWAQIEQEIAPDGPANAPDRAPLRLVRPRAIRWAVAAVVLVGLGVWAWLAQPSSEVVAVATAEIVTWAAPDGSTVVLRPNSRLARLDDEERAYRLQGEAFFDVVPDLDRPFTVEAGAAEVRVLGTQFDVSTWGGPVEVFVEEGRVRVSAGVEAIELEAGEAATANEAGIVPLPDATADTFFDWRRGELVFDQTPLRRVVDEISQHFGITILLTGGVATESVSGAIPLEGEAQVLDDLGRILGGRFEPVPAGYRFVRP